MADQDCILNCLFVLPPVFCVIEGGQQVKGYFRPQEFLQILYVVNPVDENLNYFSSNKKASMHCFNSSEISVENTTCSSFVGA